MMPAFSEVFGLHPWDVERLTVQQFEMYEHYLEQREKEARRGS